MFVLAILVAVCLIDCTVTAVGSLEKPFYNLEDAEDLFEDFLKEHEKSYHPREYKQRLEIFKKTLEDINNRNAMHPQTVFAVNHFSDLTLEEWQQHLGFKRLNSTPVKVDIPNVPLGDSLDWRTKGVVSPVQDQGQCGSCYIFSAIGNIEGQYALKHNQCPDLSEGQALDCLDTNGCDGGWPHDVMQKFAQRAGVMAEADYPYTPAKGACHEDSSKVVAHVTGGTQLDIPDENALMQALAKYGPLAVALVADDMQSYGGGILYPQQCKGKQDVDHAVVLVGYGEENGTKFWIIKNSWGVKWGEQGYVRLVRGVDACRMGTGYSGTATVN